MMRWLLLALLAGAALALFVLKRELPVGKLLRYADGESEFLELRGMRVHFRDEGVGRERPPLVLLHGTGASLHTWDGWVEVLKSDHRVVRMDLPGFGLTGPEPEGRYGPDDDIAFLDAFFDVLELDRVALAGNSLGGGIALRYALARRERVSRLILIDSSGLRHEPIPMLELVKVPLVGPVLQWLAPRVATKQMLKKVYADDSRVDDKVVARYHALSRREGNRAALRARRRAVRRSLENQLSDLSTPTLILWGKQDPWIPEANAEAFHEAIADSRLIVYPDLGHVPMEEDPERTAQDAHAFLTDAG